MCFIKKIKHLRPLGIKAAFDSRRFLASGCTAHNPRHTPLKFCVAALTPSMNNVSQIAKIRELREIQPYAFVIYV